MTIRTVDDEVSRLLVFEAQPLGSITASVLRTEHSSSMRRCAYECMNADGCVQVFWHPEKKVCHLGGYDYLGGFKTYFDAKFHIMNLS